MTDKEKCAIKIAIDTMDKYNSRYWNTRYGSLKTGVSVWYGEAISILSDMLSNADSHTCNCQHNSNSRDNEPCCRCDSRQTNADRIRNMSDEELAEFLITFKNTFGKEYEGETSCMDWLQSEAE
jgi:hypothetical protein